MIDLGQLGDVVLSLPALSAIRDRFPNSRISIIVGKSCAEIVRIAGLFDEVIEIDRVGLRRGSKIVSSFKLVKFALDVRRRRFDLVIDLHSLPETNILGFLSGAGSRLFANRESRSIDILSNFQPRPPKEDKTVHVSEYYLSTLKPLGIEGRSDGFLLQPRPSDADHVRAIFNTLGLGGKIKIGIIPGAGHPSRRWPLENFSRLALELQNDRRISAIFFLGPEEEPECEEVISRIAPGSAVMRGLTIGQLIAGLSMVETIVGNDTGPMHIGAAAGVSAVVIQNSYSPPRYLPLAKHLTSVSETEIRDIRVEQVQSAVMRMLESLSLLNTESAAMEAK